MDQSSVFPAFIRATYDDSAGGFPAFERAAQSSANRTRQIFEGAFSEIGQSVQRAMAAGLGTNGALNLNVGQYRQAAAEATAYEQSVRNLLRTATLLAKETGDTSAATRSYISALSAQAIEAERSTAQANAQVATYTRLQTALDATADRNSRLAQSYRALYAEQAAQARAEVNARNFQSGINSVFAPGLGGQTGNAAASAAAFEQAAREADDYARSAANLRAQLDPMYAAQQRFDQEMVRADRLMEAGAISTREYAAAQALARQTLQQTAQQVAGTNTAYQQATRGLGAQRFALIQTGQNLQDITVGFASGQRAAVIFAQQVPQLGFALSGFEGSTNKTLNTLGRFGTFISGPLGFIVLAAATGFAFLAESILGVGDSSDKTQGKTLSLADALSKAKVGTEEATKALREYNQEQDRTREKTEIAIASNLKLAEAKLNSAIADREKFLADMRRENPLTGEGQTGLTQATAASIQNRELAKQAAYIDELRKAVRNLRIENAEANAAAASDPIAGINKRYTDMADALKEAASGSDILSLALEGQLTWLNKLREAELDQERERQRAAGKTIRGDLAPFIMPVDGRITSGFGSRAAPIAGASKDHRGIDIAAPFGTAVKAPQVGTVKAIGFDPKLGKYVVIDHGAGTTTRFGHLSDNSVVREGQMVRQGDLIGRVGSTGNSTGNHLHYGVYQNGKAVDPRAGQFGIDSIAALEKAEREAAQAAKELRKDLEGVLGQLDPTRAAAERYAETLAKISTLERAGKSGGGLSPEEAEQYRYRLALKRIDDAARAEQDANQRVLEQYGADIELATDDISDLMVKAGRAGGQAFRDEGLAAAQAIAQVFGGKIGTLAASILGMVEGAKTGNYNSVGGRLGGALTLLSRSGSRRLTLPDGSDGGVLRPINPGFGDGFAKGIDKFGTDLKGIFKKVFGDGPMSAQVGQALGSAVAGAQMGGAIGKGLTDVLGVKGSKLGAQLGGAIGGAVAGPIGSIVGGILGSVVGGAFKKTPTGSATIGVGANGELMVTGLSGSSGKLRQAANDNAGSALTSIERIAEALGATVNASRGSVSIGFRDKNARVDVTGSGITKTSRGAIDFGSDVEAAVKYATLDLIKDGVLEGLRAGTKQLLTNAKDLEAGLDKALKFESIFTRLKSYTDPVGAALDALDKEFKNLMKIATEAGATSQEMADLEKLYGIERKKAIEEAAESTIGSLKELLRELTVGDNGRSLRDRRAAALAEYDPLRARVAAGDQTAYDAFAAASQTLLDIQRQISGSGSDYFALLDEITALTKSAISGVENVTSISAARESIFKAADLTVAVDNAPVTGAIDRMASAIVAQLSATNQNLGTLIRMQGLGSGGDDLYFQNLANF